MEKQLDAARRAGKRQAVPFAKDRPQGRGGRPGRRAGADYGTHGRRRRPTRVDETHAAPVPTACPDCGGAVEVTGAASQYQEDVPQVEPIVRHFKIAVGHCSQCRRRVQGRHRLQTSDALGAAGAQLGPNVAALVAELHTGMGLPLAKVSEHLQTKFGLDVTPGGLVHLLHRTARAAAPAYAALREQVRHSPVVTPDETGWRVNALRHWLWAFATPETTVYAICDGRGFAHAAAVLGPDFAGVLVRDGWVAYRGFKHAPHQSCLSHLLRRCKELQENHPYSPWAGEVQAVLQDGLALRDRCNAGDISEHGLASARGRLAARLGRLIDAPPPLDDAERFAKHLANEFPAVFLFLCDPSMGAFPISRSSAVCRQRWTVRLGEVEPVFGQTGRVVLDITARTAHDGALKWTRAPSTPRAARSILATFPSTCALPSGGRWSLRRVLQRPGRQRKRSSAKSSCGPSRTSSSAPSSPPCCNARCAPPRLATRRAPSCATCPGGCGATAWRPSTFAPPGARRCRSRRRTTARNTPVGRSGGRDSTP